MSERIVYPKHCPKHPDQIMYRWLFDPVERCDKCEGERIVKKVLENFEKVLRAQ